MTIFTKRPAHGSSVATLILRLLLGSIMFAHGAQKVLGIFGGQGLDATVQGFTGMGIAAPLAYLAAFTEFLGGLALILGFFTRFFSIGIMITMAVAIFMVHLNGGFFAPKGFEYPLTLGVIALAIFILGPGKYSVDHLLYYHPERTSDGTRTVVLKQSSPLRTKPNDLRPVRR
jgi:putative oxidoreductase